jgi:DNA mismatch endonuclease (patch repair protein)
LGVLIDGCYWHGCPQHGPTRFGTNAVYWTSKIAENQARDLDTTARFEAAGWRVMRFWTHTPPAEIAEAINRAVMDARRRARR